ncbi:WGR domain-containing protein [Aliikangiella sp. IMCC44359]|uniref:WGR domain-containing protein n=1 Tax=Aliikangiella sp. IMCC44359 TaxID=3459125 RepID=UPI00403AFBDC
MSKTYLEYNDEKSAKFWQIEVKEDFYVITYGKIGTNGSHTTKYFDSNESTEKDAIKLIQSKKKKGYKEITTSEPEQLDNGQKFQRIFTPLCSTDEDRAILQKLASHVIKLEDNLITFNNPSDKDYEAELEFQPGSKIVYNDYTPKSFSEIMQVTRRACWDAGGPYAGVEINENGASEATEMDFLSEEASEDPDNELLQQLSEASPSSAFWAGQNEILFDPIGKLDNGEEGLIFVSHGGGWEQIESVNHLNYKQIFLRLLSDSMVGTDYVAEVYF